MNVIHHINKNKDTNHLIISIDAEKAVVKFNIHHSFMIKKKKNLYKSQYRGNISQLIKAIHDKPTAIIILSHKKLKAFLLKHGTREGYPLSPLLFNTVLKVLATANGKLRSHKSCGIAKIKNTKIKLSLKKKKRKLDMLKIEGT